MKQDRPRFENLTRRRVIDRQPDKTEDAAARLERWANETDAAFAVFADTPAAQRRARRQAEQSPEALRMRRQEWLDDLGSAFEPAAS